jgi:ABC-type transport system involved in multi-copper enzyme maturation permease subunit
MSLINTNTFELNMPVIRLLVAKDWQLFQKQLAAYVLAALVALCFLGMASSWSFYVGSLLLLIVMVAAACFAISNSLLVERKEHTLAFVMSLPVSPLDFYLSKIIGNLLTFGVPFVVILLATLAVVMFTPLPDGLVVFALLIFGHILLAYSVSLGIAMAVESEGWNTFAMIASMVLINPFIMLLGQIPVIVDNVKTDVIVWSAPAVSILATQVVLSAVAVFVTGWIHCRKKSFY